MSLEDPVPGIDANARTWSIVTTLYHSAPYIREFHARASRAIAPLAADWEIVLVNDGSPDDAVDIAIALASEDPHVRVIDLSRNFGHHKALMTGLASSRGELVFVIDIDLEEAPELVAEFAQTMRAERADVVYGVQKARKGGIFERTLGAAFYTFFNWISTVPVPRDALIARLMTRRYVSALVRHRDREVYLGALFAITGFKQVAVPAQKLSKGTSTYTLARRFALAFNAVTGFSDKPLRVIFYLGSAISFVSFAAILLIVLLYAFRGIGVAGWGSTVASIWLMGGLTMSSLGVIGLYLAKVLSETKDRPYTVIRAEHGRGLGASEPRPTTNVAGTAETPAHRP